MLTDGGDVEDAAATRVDPVATTVEPLRSGQYVGHAAGDAANDLTFSMVSAFVLIYDTDVGGISAGTRTTILVETRATDTDSAHLLGDPTPPSCEPQRARQLLKSVMTTRAIELSLSDS